MLRGVDLSHWNNEQQFKELFNEADFFIFKATESEGYKDPTCIDRVSKCIKAGKCTGLYHFFRNSDTKRQVDNFLRIYAKFLGMTVPILDVENLGTKWHKVREWLEMVELATGVKPVIYVDYTHFNQMPRDLKDGYKIWLARYTKVEAKKIFSIHKNIVIWQSMDYSNWNGKKYRVDEDWFNGSYNQFMQLGGRS